MAILRDAASKVLANFNFNTNVFVEGSIQENLLEKIKQQQEQE